MRISTLKNVYKNKEIYIVGTGPSLRTFPKEYLESKITIGLNQAWKHLATTFSITVHPDLLLEYENTVSKPTTKWLVKKKAPLEKISLDDRKYYVFKTVDRDLRIFTNPKEDHLFLGRGVQQTAMHLAMLMGAKTIVLVGVDMTDLGGDHHGHDQHVKFHGLEPSDVYAEYRKYTSLVRKELRQLNVNVFSLSTILGEYYGSEDYLRICEELSLSKLSKPTDTSTYIRKSVDF
jgi:hypothetical protein